MMTAEKRFLQGNVEVRSEAEKPTVVEGYAALFDTETNIANQFAERVARGAFDGADMTNAVALFNHNWDKPLARVGNGLELTVDERGLKYRFELGNQSYAKDLAENIRMGNVSTSSFGFTVAEDDWERRAGGLNLRTITKVDTLYDVSPTTQGAYPTTEVGLRSMEAALAEAPVEAPVSEEVAEVVAEEPPMEESAPEEPQMASEEVVEDETEERTEEVVEVLEAPEGVGDVIKGKNPVYNEGVEALSSESISSTQTSEMSTNNNAAPAVLQNLGDTQERAAQKFSFGKMIKEAATGRLTGLEAEMNQEARNEFNNAKVNVAGGICIPGFITSRAALAVDGTNANADAFGGTIGKSDLGIIPDFYPNDLATQMGVRSLTNLSGDVVFQVENSQPTVGNPQEGAAQAVANGGFTSVTLTPTRYAAHTQVTDQMLAQSADDMGGFLAAQIRKALDKKFNETIIGAIDGAYTAGLYNAATNNPLDVEAALLAADVDLADVVALVDATSYRAFRALSHDAGSGSMFANDPQSRRNVMGYNAFISSQVATGDAHFFDKNQLVSGTWGGVNLIIDPYTDADKGVTRIIANMYRDCKALNTVGFDGLHTVA